jgi:putative peptidoglycan lipid II flippase
LNDTRVPVVGSFITVAANLIFINLTVAALSHRAIALSTSLSMIINLLFLGAMLYRKVAGFEVRYLLTTLAKVTAASLVMGLMVAWVYPLIISWVGPGLMRQLVALLSTIVLGIALYGTIISALSIPEFGQLARKLQNFRK